MKKALLIVVLIFAGVIAKAQSGGHSLPAFDVNVNDADCEHAKVTVYPNPSNGNFSVALGAFKGEAITLMILDSNGRMVNYQRKEEGNELSAINFDLSRYGKGLYILHINDGKAVHSLKLLVQG